MLSFLQTILRQGVGATENLFCIRTESGAELCRLFRSEKVYRRDFFIHHKHTALELSLILEGEGVYRTEGESYPIRAGDVFLYSPNEQHCITEAENISLLNLHFSPRLFRGSVSETCFLDLYYTRAHGTRNRIPREAAVAERIRSCFFAMLAETQRADGCTGEMLRVLLTEALVLLYRELPPAEGVTALPRPGHQSTQKVDLAVDYIDTHFERELTLEEIAAHVHLSRTYFSSLFKACYGMTPWDYINIKRIERARHLLASTDDTVLAVALSSGFNNTANFNRIFRAVTATTPQKYRAYAKKEKAT